MHYCTERFHLPFVGIHSQTLGRNRLNLAFPNYNCACIKWSNSLVGLQSFTHYIIILRHCSQTNNGRSRGESMKDGTYNQCLLLLGNIIGRLKTQWSRWWWWGNIMCGSWEMMAYTLHNGFPSTFPCVKPYLLFCFRSVIWTLYIFILIVIGFVCMIYTSGTLVGSLWWRGGSF